MLNPSITGRTAKILAPYRWAGDADSWIALAGLGLDVLPNIGVRRRCVRRLCLRRRTL